MFDLLLKGIAMGFAIAAPIGPIGILCIRKTVQFGKASGFCSGLGAAAADACYGSIAAFGLTFLSTQLEAWSKELKLIGGLFLLYLSWNSFRNKPLERALGLHKMGLVKDFIETFFLTLANPMTILCYLAVFAGVGIKDVQGSSVLLVIGIFLGSALWFLLLSEGVGLLRKKLSGNMMTWINRTASCLIAGFGIWVLATIFME